MSSYTGALPGNPLFEARSCVTIALHACCYMHAVTGCFIKHLDTNYAFGSALWHLVLASGWSYDLYFLVRNVLELDQDFCVWRGGKTVAACEGSIACIKHYTQHWPFRQTLVWTQGGIATRDKASTCELSVLLATDYKLKPGKQ